MKSRILVIDDEAEIRRSVRMILEYEGYDVPTLVSRDGVHPSAPARYRGDYSEEALRGHGYNLRNYLVLMQDAEVIRAYLGDDATAS